MEPARPIGWAADRSHERPPGVDADTVAAVGKLTEAYEYLIRARGLLYGFHQLMGHTDLLLGEAARKLRDCGHSELADLLENDVVGRNVLDGRWTFQVVDEFDDLYFARVTAAEDRIRAQLLSGRRHVFESEMKDRRRTAGRRGHERRPPARSDIVP